MSKKAAKNQKDFRPYSVGDPVLGKIRGYPPWPGVIFDPAEAPKSVQSEQPPGKKSPAHCVLFFPSGDYAWIHPKDLSSLKRHEIEAYLADEGKKRNGELREGYRIALDPHEWLTAYDKKRAAAAQIEQEAQETVDQLDSEEDGAADDSKKAKSAKKRKRDADDTPAKEKKPPKVKKSSAEPPKKKSTAGSKAKKNGTKSKALVESEDDGDNAEANGEDDDAGPSHKASPPPAKKTKREKEDEEDAKLSNDPQAIKVRDWRHKLQKVFLSNKTMPRAEAMPEIDQLVTTIETYDQMTIEQLQFSKIGKVMRHVAALPPEKIPRDSEFHFRTRAKALVEKWQEILNAHKQTSPPPLSAPLPTAADTLKHAMNGAADAGAKSDSDEVTQGAKKLDLNGNDESMLSVDLAADQTLVDADAPGDVAMSEA